MPKRRRAKRRKLTSAADKERNRIVREANKRLRLLEKQGITSPAYLIAKSKLKDLGIKGGYFTVKGKKDPKFRKKLENFAKHFLALPTSELQNAIALQQKRKAKLADRFDISEEDVEVIDEFFSHAGSRLSNDTRYEIIKATVKAILRSKGKLSKEDIISVWKKAISYITKFDEDTTKVSDLSEIGFIESQALDLGEAWLKDAIEPQQFFPNDDAVAEILRDVPNPARNGKFYGEPD